MRKKDILSLCFLAACTITATAGNKTSLKQQPNPKPRMVLTCDPECDDNNSLIRYLLHSSDFQTEAIVYSSSEYHWTGDDRGSTQYLPDREYSGYGLKIGPQKSWRWQVTDSVIEHELNEYAEAYPNLKVHDPDYPTPESLRAVFRYGNVDFEGEMCKDTPGSELIKSVFLDDKPGPVFAMSWGGANTIARALKCIEEQHKGYPGWDEIYKKVSQKVILCMSGNQDDTYPTYIATHWPDIRVQTGWGANVQLGYHAQDMVPESDKVYYSAAWQKKYLRDVGPFGPQVRVWGDGKQLYPNDIFDCFGMTDKYTSQQLLDMGYVEVHAPHPTGSFLGEGDTGNFLNQIDNGLRAWEDLTWGGWSGRNDPNAKKEKPTGEYKHNPAPKAPWLITEDLIKKLTAGPRPVSIFPDYIPAVWNSLAARFAWSATSNYSKCNHYPIVNGPLELTAAPGEKVKIAAEVGDPDGNKVKLVWRQYQVGTYPGKVTFTTPNKAATTVTIPADAVSGQTIHMVLEATDNGNIPLTRYLRTVITVK